MTDKIPFEKAMEKLEKIVDQLEAGDVSLDQALKSYEEGVHLSRICQERLNRAEKKIETLTKELDGTFTKASYDDQDPAEPKSRARGKRKAASADVDEEDLLI